MADRPTRKLTAVWFADIVGYTAVSSRDEGKALELVGILQEEARAVVQDRGGRVVKFLGDAVMAEFPSGEAALHAALELEERFRRGAEDSGGTSHLRVGVHLGELTESPDGDLYGDVVNTAARLQGAAEPDQVLVSEAVWRELHRRPSFRFTEAGSPSLKGKEEAVATWTATRRFERPGPDDPFPEGRSRDQDGSRRRLVVLPFQVLRPDAEMDFLAFGLPDAVSSSLLGLDSLVVRSPPSLPDPDRADPRKVARAAGVDLVLSGTVQRAGDRVRVSARLAEGEHGTIVWNETSTMAIGDLFELQDALRERIVSALAAPLTEEERRASAPDVPSSGAAYELYLRANQLAVAGHAWAEGIVLYEAALEEDPRYAPAWARLGRCHRLLAKYGGAGEEDSGHQVRAEEAFLRALEINPDLALAQSLYAQFQVESGRAVEGMIRLLRRASRHPSEVNLFVGLTHACRYCGLNQASLAAHRVARELDPEVVTSVAYTHLQVGNAEEALAESPTTDPSTVYALQSLGRPVEGRSEHEGLLEGETREVFEPFVETVVAAERDDLDEALRHGRRAIDGFPDPEGRYFIARCWSAVGAREEALAVLDSVVEDGFCCRDGLRREPAFSGLRSTPGFGMVLERADAARDAALDAFLQEGGERVLGAVEDGPER